MSTAHDLGSVPTRLSVKTDLVHQLITEQFPHWADLPVRPVADGGWDNFTFHLGPDLSVRLPSAAEYALAVEKEHRWLPASPRSCHCPSPPRWPRADPAVATPSPGRCTGGCPGTR